MGKEVLDTGVSLPFSCNIGGVMKSFNSGVSRLSTGVAKRLKGSPRVTPVGNSVSAIQRVENELQERVRELEARPQAVNTPVQLNTIQQESLASNATLLNTGDPDRVSSSGEVIGMVGYQKSLLTLSILWHSAAFSRIAPMVPLMAELSPIFKHQQTRR